jgi:diphosphomevalonate decarboxylase
VKVEASAPSNIALIKYMGKTRGNVPTNASLSYTLPHLRSFVTLEENPRGDEWRPLKGLPALSLSETGKTKFLNHFQRLKSHWGLLGTYTISSANNFPADCGLASSASSFAALTLATWELAKRKGLASDESRESLSRLSRLGSGSSCRSLFEPWALWKFEGAEALDLSVRLEHAVIIAGSEKKQVSSSEAHQRVNTSLLFAGRPARAEERLTALVASLKSGTWRESFEICWAEFWDMHALFATSRPSFEYMNGKTLEVLNHLRAIWTATNDGPLVTMDAGANVHILIRPEQIALADSWLKPFSIYKSWT